MKSVRTALCFSALILMAVVGIGGSVNLLAGPLNPPVGAVTGTYKTLTEVEPRIAINATNTPGDANNLFKITQAGSYYFTGNITGVFNKNTIGIATDGVTIDLCGFSLIGGGCLDGIATTTASLTDITIRNGSIRNCSGDGIDLSTNISANTLVSDIVASGNGGVGIKVASNYIIERCGCRLNGGGGILTGQLGVVRACQTISNSTAGLVVGQGSTISDCISGFNLGTVDAMRTGGYCSIHNCTVNNSNGNGLVVGNVSTITGCTINGASLAGIQTGFGCTIAHTGVNFAQTINIVVGTGCTVTDCTVQFGNQGGIECSQQCIIRNNLCSQNANGSGTGFNIHATGADNRIEGNNCTQAGRGIFVAAAGNIIARNTCSGNATNWDIAAGNICVVVQGAAGAAILGNTGGSPPGSADPSANFTY